MRSEAEEERRVCGIHSPIRDISRASILASPPAEVGAAQNLDAQVLSPIAT